MSTARYEWQSPRQTPQEDPAPTGSAASTAPPTLAVASLAALVLVGLVSALAWPAPSLLAGLAVIPAVLAVGTVLTAMTQSTARARVPSFVLAGVVALVALGAIVVVVVVAAAS